jgi:hypothetical protein
MLLPAMPATSRPTRSILSGHYSHHAAKLAFQFYYLKKQKPSGKQMCCVALLQQFLSLRFTINCIILSYILPCDGLSALLQDTGRIHTDNS